MPPAGSLRFAAAITCLDGRVQRPVVDHLRRRYGFDYVDLVTVPGPERALAGVAGLREVSYVHRNLAFSLQSHGASLVAVAAHDDCAANDAEPAERLEQFEDALATVREWCGTVPVLGLWVDAIGGIRELSGVDLAPIPIPPMERSREPSSPPPPPRVRPTDAGDQAVIAGLAGFFAGFAVGKLRRPPSRD